MAAKIAPTSNGVAPGSTRRNQGRSLELEQRTVTTVSHQSSKRTKSVEDESLFGSLCSLLRDHQVGISVNLVLLLFLTHTFFPRARRRTTKFLHLSYYNPDTEQYGCGTDDLAFVALWVVTLTGLRVAVMDYLFGPLAKVFGVKNGKDVARFKEQGWLLVYYTVSWSLGMYILYYSQFWLNLNELWSGWPHREISGLGKWYYLVQLASGLQQNLVVNIEEKRGDYSQMSAYHILTSAFVLFSYGSFQTPLGTSFLVVMDFVDMVLPMVKLLRYTGFTIVCDLAFTSFVLGWVITRHVFFALICWSVYAHAPSAMAPGCYLADGSMVPMSSETGFAALGGNDLWGNIITALTEPSETICWNPTMRYAFLGPLVAIQAFLLVWFASIIRIVLQVVFGQGTDSGESETGFSIENDTSTARTTVEIVPVEQEVGVEELSFARKGSPGVKNYRRSLNRSSGSRASGISIPGHGDRKELLGRIGCDKPS